MTFNGIPNMFTTTGTTTGSSISPNTNIGATTIGGFSSGSSVSKITNTNGQLVINLPVNESTIEIPGRIKMAGEYLDERLKRIEDRLYIPQRNVIMEQKYKKLADLWVEYNETVLALNNWETLGNQNET